jgi:PilZ domain
MVRYSSHQLVIWRNDLAAEQNIHALFLHWHTSGLDPTSSFGDLIALASIDTPSPRRASKMSYIPDYANQVPTFRNGNRRARRSFVRMPACIRVDSEDEEQVAFVKDISPDGIFFYSNLDVIEGRQLTFVLKYVNDQLHSVRLPLSGIIKRVERGTPGSAIGVAVAFDRSHDDVPCRYREVAPFATRSTFPTHSYPIAGLHGRVVSSEL